MTDPATAVTVGTLAALALSEAIKAGIGAAIKDAYDALKTEVAKFCGRDVEALEADPSKPRQEIIAMEIDKLPRPEKDAVLSLAEALQAAFPSDGGNTALISFKKLKAKNVRLDDVSVAKGPIFRADEATLEGDLIATRLRQDRPDHGVPESVKKN